MPGIDVAKDNLVCTLVDPATRRTLWERTVPNTAAGIQRLLGATPRGIAWVPEFKSQYEREQAEGLSDKAALCAVARTMAKVCWSIVEHGSEYDPQRVYRQPNSKEKT